LLTSLIGLVTNLAFYGRVSTAFISPADNRLGLWVLVVPAIGGLLVGVLARYGSRAIRGHGIPEAMEQILVGGSRIPPRITFLKPLSAAIAIGTGGPFGAEGPIIATGGAFGSLIGQLLHTTAIERKSLLAAGAAAGMTATFGSPVAAVLLAVELLLFEFRPRSLLPVALASATATVIRYAAVGAAPVFPLNGVAATGEGALTFYMLLGAVLGVAAVGITRLVYRIEDAFEKLPLHWMWWPALGGMFVGAVGLVAPHTLGVGYDNIEHIVSGSLVGTALLVLVLMKLASWAVSLGSGTSGGTLAPLFTIGGGLGAVIGELVVHAFPSLGIDPRVAALVGMAALFAGASRALLASVVFAFETTLQPMGILPLLAGCTMSYLVSSLMMRNTIMTEKIVRRGIRVPSEYEADYLSQISVRQVLPGQRPVVLTAEAMLGSVQAWLASGEPGSTHQGFPVEDAGGHLVGVLTRRDLIGIDAPMETPLAALIKRPPITVRDTDSLRDAADLMATYHVGRLPVVSTAEPSELVGILSRSDLIAAHVQRLEEASHTKRHIRIRASLRQLARTKPSS